MKKINKSEIFISIIIPTLNRAGSLAKTLASLSVQITRTEFEIIIVDNGSTDHTRTVSLRFIKKTPELNIKYIFEPSPGLLAARHKGAQIAQGDILIYIDDDVDLSPGWLEAICNCFLQNPSTILVGGKSLPLFEIPPPDWLRVLWSSVPAGKMCPYLSLIDLGYNQKQINPRYVFGLNYAIRKTALYRYGGFNPELYPPGLQRFQGDGETGLSDKIIAANKKAVYLPGAAVYHRISKTRLTKKYIYRRAYSQGVSDSYTHFRQGKSAQFSIFAYLSYIFQKMTLSEAELSFLSKINQAYKNGYNFHRKQVLSDHKLANWINKPDYFDYSLPM